MSVCGVQTGGWTDSSARISKTNRMNPIYTRLHGIGKTRIRDFRSLSPCSLPRKSKCMSNAAASTAQADFRVVSAFLPSIWSYFRKIGWRAGWISWHFPWEEEGRWTAHLSPQCLLPTTNQLRILATPPHGAQYPLGDKVWCWRGFCTALNLYCQTFMKV